MGTNVIKKMFFLLTFLAAPAVGICSDGSIEYNVKLAQDDSSKVHIAIHNQGISDIVVDKHSLPWANAGKMLMVGIDLGTYRQLEETIPISDPIKSQEVILKKGSCLDGSFKLTERFPDIEKHLQDSDVLIFWSHVLRFKFGGISERQGGWFIVPKK